jgi:hypothetical protein
MVVGLIGGSELLEVDGRGDGGEMVLVFDRQQVAAVLEAWAEYGEVPFTLTFEEVRE